MADVKYLDYAGLQVLVTKIKAGDAQALADAKAYVGTIPAEATQTTAIDYLMAEIAKAQAAATFSGKASDVTIQDANDKFTSTNVEGALAEVKTIADANAADLVVVKGDANTAGSIAKALKDAKDYTDSEIGVLKIGETSYATVKAYVDAKDAAIVRLIDGETGDLSDLTTTTKANVVAAINEVKGLADDAQSAADDAQSAADDAQADATSALDKIGTAKTAEKAGTGLTGRIEVIEAAIGEGGGVSEQIDAKINALDATVTNVPTEEGATLPDVQVTVVETDGKLTSVSATVTANRFDAYGAAKAVADTLGTAAAKDVATTAIAEDTTDTNLVTAAQVAKFVKDEVADLEGATHFIGIKTELPTEGMKSGDICIVGVKEYIYDGTEWKELGDESIYVTKTTTIAGVDLENNITKEEMLTALNVADGAQVNVIEGVQVNGTDLAITDKKVNVTVATGATNGTVAVNGVDVAVKGLGSAAYTDATAYDEAGAAAAVLGTAADDKTKVTVYGVKAYVDDLVGEGGSVETQIKEAIEALDYTTAPTTGEDYVKSITETDGVIAPVYGTFNFDEKGAAAAVQGNTTATVKSLEDRLDEITSITSDEITALFTTTE